MLGRSGENALTPEHGPLRDHYYDAAHYLFLMIYFLSMVSSEGLAECYLVLVLYMSHEHILLHLHEF